MLEVRITRLPFPQRIGTNTAFKIYESPLPDKTKNRFPDDPFQANSIPRYLIGKSLSNRGPAHRMLWPPISGPATQKNWPLFMQPFHIANSPGAEIESRYLQSGTSVDLSDISQLF